MSELSQDNSVVAKSVLAYAQGCGQPPSTSSSERSPQTSGLHGEGWAYRKKRLRIMPPCSCGSGKRAESGTAVTLMTVVAIAAGLGAEHYDVSGISCTQGLAICHDCGRACTTQTSFSFSSNLWSPLRRASVRVRCTPAADSATRSDSGRVFIHGRQVGAIVRSGVGVGVRVPIEGRKPTSRPCVDRCHSRALPARLPKPRRRGGRCLWSPGRLRSNEKEGSTFDALLMHRASGVAKTLVK